MVLMYCSSISCFSRKKISFLQPIIAENSNEFSSLINNNITLMLYARQPAYDDIHDGYVVRKTPGGLKH